MPRRPQLKHGTSSTTDDLGGGRVGCGGCCVMVVGRQGNGRNASSLRMRGRVGGRAGVAAARRLVHIQCASGGRGGRVARVDCTSVGESALRLLTLSAPVPSPTQASLACCCARATVETVGGRTAAVNPTLWLQNNRLPTVGCAF